MRVCVCVCIWEHSNVGAGLCLSSPYCVYVCVHFWVLLLVGVCVCVCAFVSDCVFLGMWGLVSSSAPSSVFVCVFTFVSSSWCVLVLKCKCLFLYICVQACVLVCKCVSEYYFLCVCVCVWLKSVRRLKCRLLHSGWRVASSNVPQGPVEIDHRCRSIKYSKCSFL